MMDGSPMSDASRDITALIQRDSIADVNTPSFEILRQAAAPLAVLGDLASSNDANVRMWVVFALRDGAATGGAEILERLGRDRDPDVRTEAITALVKLNPERARRQVPSLIKKLASTDYYEPISAMWALAELGATQAAPAIRTAGDRWDANDWHHKVAAIILALLEGRTDEILERIRAHDHVAMKWLARAAALAATSDAVDALRSAGQNPNLDEECLNYVRRALSRLGVDSSG